MLNKNFFYRIVIFFEIKDQLSNLSLFAIPIKSIKIIDNGTIFPLINNLLSIVGINIITMGTYLKGFKSYFWSIIFLICFTDIKDVNNNV